MDDDGTLSVPPSLKRVAVTVGEVLVALIFIAVAGLLVGVGSYFVLTEGLGYEHQAARLVATLLGGFVAVLIPIFKFWMSVFKGAIHFWGHTSETFDTRRHAAMHTAKTFGACGAAGLAVLVPAAIFEFPYDVIGSALMFIGVLLVSPVLIRLLKCARPLTAQEQRALWSDDADPPYAIYIATPVLATVNGAAIGVGPLRRIFLNEMAVKELTDEHLEVILYHEIGHLTLGHVRHQFIYAVVVILIALVFPFFVGGDTWGLVLMIAAIGGILAIPHRHIQRQHEHEADAFAMEQVENPEQAIEALAALRDLQESAGSATTAEDRLQQLLRTHPPLDERIAHLETLRD